MKLLNPEGVFYATLDSAAFDIPSSEDVVVPAHGWVLVPTGLKLDTTERTGDCLLILSRSGLAAKQGVFVLNSPGVCDEDFCGEICVILANMSDVDVALPKGSRVAQGMVVGAGTMRNVSIKNSVRGTGGFGSSGV